VSICTWLALHGHEKNAALAAHTQAQLDQQRERDEHAEAEAAEKGRRHQLLLSTKEGLEAERARIRLLVRHYLPVAADVDAVLDGAI
jgi:hypothetical protein